MRGVDDKMQTAIGRANGCLLIKQRPEISHTLNIGSLELRGELDDLCPGFGIRSDEAEHGRHGLRRAPYP